MAESERLTNDEIREAFECYGKEDYLTSEDPYMVLVETTRAIKDELVKQRIINTVRLMAKETGCPNTTFNGLLKAAMTGTGKDTSQQAGGGFSGIEMLLSGKHPDYGQYSCSDQGVWLFDQISNQKVMICSHPVFPTRRYTNIETGSELLDLSYRQDGQWKTRPMIPRQTIAQARQLAGLSEFGIGVTSENAKDMVKYLSTMDDLNRSIIPRADTISRLGWVEGRGFSPYISDVAYDSAGKFDDAYAAVHKAGFFDVWLNTVKDIRARNTTKVPQIFMAASVASVILKWTCNQPFMVHVWSTKSGSGKTVSLMLAASIWADPSLGRYIRSMDATNVAFEQLATFCNNMPLCLDELQTIQKNKDFDDIIYMLCEGTGRARSTKNLGVREQSHWLNTILTNGEMPIVDDSRGGAINRVISLEASGLLFPGTEDDLGPLAEMLRCNYGFAGEMIVNAIAQDNSWTERISQEYRKNVNILLKKATGKQANYGAALLAADWLFDQLVVHDGRVLQADDILPYLATPEMVDMNLRARDWVIGYIASNVRNLWIERDGQFMGDVPPINLIGKRGKDGNIYILQNQLKAAMKASKLDFIAFMRWCNDHGYIKTYHKSATDRHWGIPQDFPGVGKSANAICFKQEMFKAVDSQGTEGNDGRWDFPF